MFFIKNLPTFERILRVFGGIGMAVVGFLLFKGNLWGYLSIASGTFTVLTGFVGFCPMCAMVGRKLDKAK